MPVKTSDEIRKDFFNFFEEKQHLIVDSAPVVPKNDPTLLFTNAGMNQFKAIFLGDEPGYKAGDKIWSRTANTQRCIRVSGKHNDLDEVGHDTYHHTLFEMLGNWSFGDYFKEEAIEWAWELLVDRWGLEPDRLYATVFGGDKEDGLPVDEEAIELWKKKTDINPDHILRFGKKDNFWEMGQTGPCGPCSEVHVDLRPDKERKKQPGAELVNMDDPWVMEIWNLVFIQFFRDEEGKLSNLPDQHVDTGMGFERICAVLQGKTSNYDTDVFEPLLEFISGICGKPYGHDLETDIAMRVIADHIRAVSFSIADGASPSNDGRGYVIRRILRRAVRYGWDRLALKKPFMYQIVPVLAEQFKGVFPELASQVEYVQNVIKAEEKSFLRTLGQGIELFEEMTEGEDKISGENAFKLHDTYGFPIDLTQLMAREKGIDVDLDGFETLMKQQKERARADGKFAAGESGKNVELLIEDYTFEFTGYDHLISEAAIAAVNRDEKRPSLWLTRSPFYAESGGQIADTGTIENNGEVIRVKDVQKTPQGFEHIVDRIPDDLSGTWTAEVHRERRLEIQKHHTATHLMHAALRETIGDHVVQKGSLVEPGRLRFDFSHFEAVTPEQLDEMEARVNEKIQENIEQDVQVMDIEQARERGAMMLFGEKYGDRVRVVTFDPKFSMELCGGTHVGATGEIGYFRFLHESSAAAGIRRVEAVAGKAADKLIRNEKSALKQIQAMLGNSENPAAEIEKLIAQNRDLGKEIEKLKKKDASGALDQILEEGTETAGVSLYTGEVPGADMDLLKQMGYRALQLKDSGSVFVLASQNSEGKVFLMAAITPDLNEKGLQAGKLVSQLGRIVGGGGGGQPELATAGGRFPDKIGEAFGTAEKWIKEQLT
ncbi:alanine--tRNA ligase [Rhodohalobacter sp. SW132]|uniref:alanine--tRNA ligase n=1 Tax=Rhodohalobacter sp. SW132 TaxID=2293433 RepID=UPI000E26B9D3|nr:alanine--tRNA ligase [Rhodohalobacter sp. SW132]REL24074.1 alanine--tRNA ligase [Rhodohalobacter sp. SW132]